MYNQSYVVLPGRAVVADIMSARGSAQEAFLLESPVEGEGNRGPADSGVLCKGSGHCILAALAEAHGILICRC